MNGFHNNNVLILGRAGLDLYAEPPGTPMEDADHFYATVGGSAANIAVGLVRQGGQATLLTCVSNDAVGRTTIKKLKHFGVETTLIRAVGGEARNSLAIVETRTQNCQSVIYRNGAADFELRTNDVDQIAFQNFGALIITGTCLAVDPSRSATLLAMKKARAAGLRIIIDIDHRPYSWTSADEAMNFYNRAASACDIVIGNDDEFAVMAGQDKPAGLKLARHLAQTSTQIVVYKMGERGSITMSKTEEFETPIFPVKALKPTGAGDAFMAGFITGLGHGLALRGCVRRGSAAAAIVVGRVGCAPAMPTTDELNHFMASIQTDIEK